MPDGEHTLSNVDLVRRYLAALENDDPAIDVGEFFAPDAQQIEWPNRLVPDGATRDVAGLRDGRARGRAVIRDHRFEIDNVIAVDDQVAVEARWSGELRVPLGSLKPGDRMRARFAIFIELRDGKIIRQRNYDCFDPF